MTSHGVSRISGKSSAPISDEAREIEITKVKEYRDLVDLVQSKIRDQKLTLELLQLTSKLLTINPEYYTVWNHRRRVLQELFAAHAGTFPPGETSQSLNGQEDNLNLLNTDLAFVFALLRRFPKCYWIWNHRLWLLREASVYLPTDAARELWQGELKLVGKMLTLDNRNFHGWGYRRTVVDALESKELSLNGAQTTLVEEEFDYTNRMIRTSMSNFSAWHRRSRLIPILLEERGAGSDERRKMLDDELILIQEGLYTDSQDQSLWFYHQYLMCTFDPSLAAQSVAPGLSPDERLTYIQSEMSKLVEMLEGDEDSKWTYQALVQLAMLFHESAGRLPPEAKSIKKWIASLKKLDPMRQGRWIDLEESIRASLEIEIE